MKGPEFEKQLLRRLDILISLQLESAPAESEVSISGKVRRLIALGLKPGEVGSVLGKPVNYITAVLATGVRRKAKG